jgi:hypothetical protein
VRTEKEVKNMYEQVHKKVKRADKINKNQKNVERKIRTRKQENVFSLLRISVGQNVKSLKNLASS